MSGPLQALRYATYTMSMRRLTRRGATPRTVDYAPGHGRVADLYLPGGDGPAAAVVLVHGGYWRMPWSRNLMNALAGDLAGRGLAVWNIEYRRLGAGGGWPATFDDVAAAIDALAGADPRIDATRVAVAGHSAGGHLAAWAAARRGLPVTAPGGAPRVLPRAVVSLAGVLDLREAAARGLGDGAARELLGGGPDEVGERYALASPADRLPLGVEQLLVHGDADDTVPLDLSERYVERAAAAGDAATLLRVDGGDHFSVIDPQHPGWDAVAGWIAERLA